MRNRAHVGFAFVEDVYHVYGRLVGEARVVHVELELRYAAVDGRVRIVYLQLVVGGKLRDDARLARSQRIVRPVAGDAPDAFGVSIVVAVGLGPDGQGGARLAGRQVGKVDAVQIFGLLRIVVYLVELVAEIHASCRRAAACVVDFLQQQRADSQALHRDVQGRSALVDGFVYDVAVHRVLVAFFIIHGAGDRDGIDAGDDSVYRDGVDAVELFGDVQVLVVVVESHGEVFRRCHVRHVQCQVDAYFDGGDCLCTVRVFEVFARGESGCAGNREQAFYVGSHISVHCWGVKGLMTIPVRRRSGCSAS